MSDRSAAAVRERIVTALGDFHADGHDYVRASRLADEIGETPQRIGTNLRELEERGVVERADWGNARGTRWRVAET